MEGKKKELVMKVAPPSASSALNSSSTTPRALLRSLVKFPTRHCMKKEEREKKKKNNKEKEARVDAESSEESPVPETAVAREEASFYSGRGPETAAPINLGSSGVGLVFLILVKSATEFSKIIEIQRQMEVLLKDIKGEMQRRNVTSSYLDSKNQTVHSSSNCWVEESSSNPIFLQNNDVPYLGPHAGMECDRQSAILEKKRCPKINQLEEELEVELERLQNKMEKENLPVQVPQQQRKELDSEDTNRSESLSPDFEEACNEPKQDANRDNHGVCPRELERRLHELLELRQQEKISALETELECAERRLQEKETEISWWRDTARLVSKHRSEASLFR